MDKTLLSAVADVLKDERKTTQAAFEELRGLFSTAITEKTDSLSRAMTELAEQQRAGDAESQSRLEHAAVGLQKQISSLNEVADDFAAKLAVLEGLDERISNDLRGEIKLAAELATQELDDSYRTVLQDIEALEKRLVARQDAEREKIVSAVRAQVKDGEPGEPGPRGERGPAGEDANPDQVAERIKKDLEFVREIRGADGGPGPQGDPGEPGAPGRPGADADPVVVADVIKKDLEFVREIRGADGGPGPQGEPGEPGAPGQPGADADPVVVADVIKRDSAFVGSLRGKDGQDGRDGRDGLDRITVAPREMKSGDQIRRNEIIFHNGGLFQAKQKTTATPDEQPAAYLPIVQGISKFAHEFDPEDRFNYIVVELSDGETRTLGFFDGPRLRYEADGLTAIKGDVRVENECLELFDGEEWVVAVQLRGIRGRGGKKGDKGDPGQTPTKKELRTLIDAALGDVVESGEFLDFVKDFITSIVMPQQEDIDQEIKRFAGGWHDGKSYSAGDVVSAPRGLYLALRDTSDELYNTEAWIRMMGAEGGLMGGGGGGAGGAGISPLPGTSILSSTGGIQSWVAGSGLIKTAIDAGDRIAQGVDVNGGLSIQTDDGSLWHRLVLPGSPANRWVPVMPTPATDTTLMRLEWDPANAQRVSWADDRLSLESVNDASNRLAIPQSHLVQGKLVFQEDTLVLYKYIATTPTGTEADWQVVGGGGGGLTVYSANTAAILARPGANQNAKIDSLFTPVANDGALLFVGHDANLNANNSLEGGWLRDNGAWIQVVKSTSAGHGIYEAGAAALFALSPVDAETALGAAGGFAALFPTATPKIGDLVLVSGGSAAQAHYNGTYVRETATVWKRLSVDVSRYVYGSVKNLVADPDPTVTGWPSGSFLTTLENLNHEIKTIDSAGNIQLIYSEDLVHQWIAAGSLFRGTISQLEFDGTNTAIPAPAAANRGWYFTWSGNANYVIQPTDAVVGGFLAGQTLQIGDWIQYAPGATPADPDRLVHVSGDLLSRARWLGLGSFNMYSPGSSYESQSLVRWQPNPNAPLRYFQAAQPVTGAANEILPGLVATGTQVQPWVDITPSASISTLGDVDHTNAPLDGQGLTFSVAKAKWEPTPAAVPKLPKGVPVPPAQPLDDANLFLRLAINPTGDGTLSSDSAAQTPGTASYQMQACSPEGSVSRAIEARIGADDVYNSGYTVNVNRNTVSGQVTMTIALAPGMSFRTPFTLDNIVTELSGTETDDSKNSPTGNMHRLISLTAAPALVTLQWGIGAEVPLSREILNFAFPVSSFASGNRNYTLGLNGSRYDLRPYSDNVIVPSTRQSPTSVSFGSAAGTAAADTAVGILNRLDFVLASNINGTGTQWRQANFANRIDELNDVDLPQNWEQNANPVANQVFVLTWRGGTTKKWGAEWCFERGSTVGETLIWNGQRWTAQQRIFMPVGNAAGDTLSWDAANSRWQNVAAGAANALAGLTDTTITTPNDQDTLVWDNTNSVWINVRKPYYTQAETDAAIATVVGGLAHEAPVLARLIEEPNNPPPEASTYIVMPNARGAWAGQDNNIAIFERGVWVFETPQANETHLIEALQENWTWNGTNWVKVSGGAAPVALGLTAPAAPTHGQMWWNGSRMYVWDTSNVWVQI